MSPLSGGGELSASRCSACGGDNGHHFKHCPSLAVAAQRGYVDQDAGGASADVCAFCTLGPEGEHESACPVVRPSDPDDRAPCCGVPPGSRHTEACRCGSLIYHGRVGASLASEQHRQKRESDERARERLNQITPPGKVHERMAEDLSKAIHDGMIEATARVAHEVNRAYARSTGDFSHVPWTELGEEMRRSTIAGVLHFLSNPETTPEESHAVWMKDRLAAGWRYAETKNERARTHPCLVPYEQLPADQRTKDHLFLAVCRVMMTPR